MHFVKEICVAAVVPRENICLAYGTIYIDKGEEGPLKYCNLHGNIPFGNGVGRWGIN